MGNAVTAHNPAGRRLEALHLARATTGVSPAARVRERYVLGDAVHVHARWRPGDSPAVEHLCARFHWLFSTPEPREAALALDASGSLEPLIEDEASAVFVDVVDLVQDVGRISGRVSGVSLVWVGPVHCCDGNATNALFETSPVESVTHLEVMRLLDAWKQELVDPAGGARSAPYRLRTDPVTARRPRVTGGAAGEARAWHREAGMACPVRLEIDAADARAVGRPRAQGTGFLKVVDVFIGPRPA